MGLFSKKKKEETLIDFTNSQLTNNSLLVNYTKNGTKKMIDFSINGSKKIVVPLSKIIDYSFISILTIALYKTFMLNIDLFTF
jgi:hypothetical protein|tara:strand:+ start:472 stop:720 length:249 start_codon:yes stop_codon:yes gene_type:complete